MLSVFFRYVEDGRMDLSALITDRVAAQDAVEMYRALPDGELAVVPGTSHGLLVEKPELCNRIILDFLEGEAVATLAPIRRR